MGAPIYLVSACSSGEEFVAAFRRYADKNGLFIPIGDPLPPGRRSRFAVTLRDGGVMIEGEAEIVNSARVPSVLHGRIGMTLRFVAPDEASRTTLGELEKARLAMKPAPPSVPPRPAELPAEPRPIPPPIQGRIDAVNALAECVAIGDVSVLGPPLPPAPAVPPRAGTRSVAPTIPPVRSAPGTSPPGALGVASRAAAPRTPTSPLQIPIARPDPRDDAEPPAITPRATPQPDRLRSAERPVVPEAIASLSQTMTAVEVEPGPPSDTMVAVTPPPGATLPPEPAQLPEASGRFDRGPLSATMTAVPMPSANPPSAPTQIGGPLVVPIHADDEISARTQIHAGAPRPPAPQAVPGPAALRVDTAPQRAPEPRTGAPVSVTIHGTTLEPRPPAPLLPDLEIAEPTDISMPPEPPSSPSAELLAEPLPSTEPEAILRAGPVDEPAGEPSTEPSGARSVVGLSDQIEAQRGEPIGDLIGEPLDAPVIQESGAITNQRSVEPGLDDTPRPRRTVIGVAVQPTGVLIPPAPSRREPVVAAPDEPTGIIVGDPTVDPGAATVPPDSEQLSAADPPREPMPATPAVISGPLPSGDWTIALDPAAPDGWSPPRQAVRRPPQPGGLTAAASDAPGADGASPHRSAPLGANGLPDPGAVRTLRPGEISTGEPKVQIDPTLIEPRAVLLPTAESPAMSGVAPELAQYGAEPGREAVEAPALHAVMAVPQPGPYASPAMHGGPAPGYPADPPYPMMPGAPPSRLATADGSGFGPVRYPPQPAQVRRRHLVIMLATAVVAVLLGIAAMLLFRRSPAAVPPADDRPGATDTPTPGESPRAPADPRTGEPAAPPPAGTAPAGAAPAGAQAAPPPVAPSAEPAAPPPAVTAPGGAAPTTPPGSAGSDEPAAPHAAAPAPGDCYAEVSSVPPGAEIVLDQATVLGTTPQRVALPCGRPVELLVRKPHLVPATHTITPSPDGTSVQFVLVRQTFLVKVSSMPAGATVTLGGKPLGVTPTMVKVPAFESSTLSIAKDGYETETETVAPKGNGTAVHSVLKKTDRKRPR